MALARQLCVNSVDRKNKEGKDFLHLKTWGIPRELQNTGVLPSEYDRWAPVTIKYGFRMFGVSIAWTIARVVNSFYSSIRGSEMFLLGLISYVSRRGYVDRVRMEPGGPIFTLLFIGLAALGFLIQFRSGYKVPFPFNILLSPLSILEYFIIWSVAIDKQV
mmetsp:Transcript_32084/g.125062  ORF Transcript_32084/g.125062 Transcript_32084/m.125062 type:complete len:161 (-) Transcript_32084:2086-2568(-)